MKTARRNFNCLVGMEQVKVLSTSTQYSVGRPLEVHPSFVKLGTGYRVLSTGY